MKYFRFLTTLCVASLLVDGASAQRRGLLRKVRPERSIVVLYDNDVHCAVQGYPYMAGMRDAVRDTAWCALVSEGDFLQGGTPGAVSRGGYVADIMQAMGYDAITLGNHEFDYRLPRMRELLGQIGAPVTCCNFRHIADDRIVFDNFVMKKMGGRKVAFVGVTTPTTLLSERYAFTDETGCLAYDFCESKLCQRVQDAVNDARCAGADYVVLLCHVGEDESTLSITSHQIVAATRGIDVVLDGHTHSVVRGTLVANKDGKEVLVAQTGSKFAHIGKLLIMPDGTITNELIPVRSLTRRSPIVAQITDSIVANMERTTAEVLGTCDCELNIHDENGRQGTRLHEMPVGNLVTDAYRAITGADIAITNGGGLRSDVKRGRITYGDIVALLPFDSRLVTIELTGDKMVEVLDAASQRLPREDGQFAQCSGMRYCIDMNAKADSVGFFHRVCHVQVFDKERGEYVPIEPERCYRLATIEYCVTGGVMAGAMKGVKIVEQHNLLYSAAVARFIVDHLHCHIGKEYGKTEGRITIIDQQKNI